MTAILVSGPVVEPLSLAEAKSWIKVDASDEDALIQSLIISARIAVEAATNRFLISQQWRLVMDAWPVGGSLALALTPVRSVSRIRTLDAAGVASDVPVAQYSLDASLDHARILLGPAVPTPGVATNGITIDLMVGYGDATAVPEPFRLAIRHLVALWFANRGDGDALATRMPTAVLALLAPYRIRRLA